MLEALACLRSKVKPDNLLPGNHLAARFDTKSAAMLLLDSSCYAWMLQCILPCQVLAYCAVACVASTLTSVAQPAES